jgi:hypothetical protein
LQAAINDREEPDMKIKTKVRAGGSLPVRDDGSSGGGRGCG